MIIVGLTGGIGSGKTTVAKLFQEYRIPIYIADKEAKSLIDTHSEVKNQIIEVFGKKSYENGVYNRSYISKCVFENRDLLEKLNAIVHPAVKLHFENWLTQQNSPYVIKEAAILFESGSYKDCDCIINVVASEKERIRRVKERDGLTELQIRQRMQSQWSDEQRNELSDVIIHNEDLENTKKQVKKIHTYLKNQPYIRRNEFI